MPKYISSQPFHRDKYHEYLHERFGFACNNTFLSSVNLNITKERATLSTFIESDTQKLFQQIRFTEIEEKPEQFQRFPRHNLSGKIDTIQHPLFIPKTWDAYNGAKILYIVESSMDALTLLLAGQYAIGCRTCGSITDPRFFQTLNAFLSYTGIQHLCIIPDVFPAFDKWVREFKTSLNGANNYQFIDMRRYVRDVTPEAYDLLYRKEEFIAKGTRLQDFKRMLKQVNALTTKYDVNWLWQHHNFNADTLLSTLKKYQTTRPELIEVPVIPTSERPKQVSLDSVIDKTMQSDVLPLFDNVQPIKPIKNSIESYYADCPLCDNNMTISLSSDNKTVLYKCHTGCSGRDVAESVQAPFYLDKSQSTSTKHTTTQISSTVPPPTDADYQNVSEKPQTFHLTDLGNAKRLVALHGDNLRYCPEHDKWFVWSGKKWDMDTGRTINVYRHATDIVKSIYKEAAGTDDHDTRKALGKFAKDCESKKRLQDMVFLAAREPKMVIDHHKFDTYPFLLNVANGMLDLSSGKLHEHDKRRLLTKSLSMTFNPDATCPEWQKFVHVIMDGNEGLIEFLRRAMGYTLTGDVSEDCLFFLYGTGKNGKSTFINILSFLLGEYRQHLKIESLLAKKYEGIPNDIARLPGARLVTTTEIPEYRRMNESLVKDLTGGDEMSARFMKGEWFSFYPKFKLWMFGNHKPQISGTDDGIWRRIRLIPFTVQILPEQQLPRRVIEGSLHDEAEGILAWMVRGCLDWQKNGLQAPQEVIEATAQYRTEMDVVADFFESHTVIGVDKVCTKKDLYETYVGWSKDLNRFFDGSRQFNNKVRERFPTVQDSRGTGNRPIWRGIGLCE